MSDSSKTEKRRENRLKKAGQARKKNLAKGTTPKFPIHPEGSKKKNASAKDS